MTSSTNVRSHAIFSFFILIFQPVQSYLGLTVSNSKGFGLFQQLQYIFSLNFTPGLQSAFYTDQLDYQPLFREMSQRSLTKSNSSEWRKSSLLEITL